MKITQLRLPDCSLQAQHAFYGERLGLPTRWVDDALHVQAGTTTLIFVPVAPEESRVHHFAFNIPENQFAEAKAWLQMRMPLHTDASGQDEFHFEGWNAHAVYAFDANGNIIEFIARHDLPNANATPFSAASLLNISEIGWVTPNVRKQVGQLATQYGLPIYDGNGSDVFTAVGDPNGLFIVVAENRLWYPDTGVAAQTSPVAVTIETGNLTHKPPPEISNLLDTE